MVAITKTLHVKTAEKWRQWLAKNHASEKEIWLVFYKKGSGKMGLSYDLALDEALCFGWIDSLVKRIDDEKYVQKFSPRKAGSKWSEINKAKIAKLKLEGRMEEAGLKTLIAPEKKRDKGSFLKPGDKLVVPKDLQEALNKNKKARENFESFAPSYRRDYLNWINSAKKPETRKRRIEWALLLLEQKKKELMF